MPDKNIINEIIQINPLEEKTIESKRSRKWEDSDEGKKWIKDYYEKNKEHKRSYGIEYYNRNKLMMNQKNKARNNGFRLGIIEYLGRKCAYCGFDDIRALQLDHIHGGGTKIRKGTHYYKYNKYYFNHLDEAKKIFQVLCANCNWIKLAERGERYSRTF